MLKFIAIFFAVNFLANWYIFSRVFSFFHWKIGIFYWILILFFSISYVIIMSLDQAVGFFLTRWMLRLAGFWMGAGLILLMSLLAHDVVRLIIPISLNISRWVVLGVAGALVIYALLNARIVQVKVITVPAPLDKTIVQLSDIHVGSVSPSHLRRLVHMTNRLNPDLVLFTGDLMDSWSGLSDRSFASLKELQAPIYFVTGNHERYTGMKLVEDLVSRTPMIPLRNRSVEWEGIQLIGIDDSENAKSVEAIISELNIVPQKYSILMYHRPNVFEASAQMGIDLMLSGHTHNGQIWPFNFVVKSHFPRIKGLYKLGQSTLFVSTGAGTWGPPMRLGSRSQIVVIKLHKKQDAS